MALLNHFQRANHSEPQHRWDRCVHDEASRPVCDLAADVAEEAVRLRCGGVPGLFTSWVSKRGGNGHTLPNAKTMLSAFVRPSFGVPGAPPSANHLEGAVGELIWYLLVRDFTHEPALVYLAEPSLSPLDHGGDGFAVHVGSGGSLVFRLWEVKKNTGGSPISSTVATAYNQLTERGTEYLARLIPQEQRNPDPNVRALVSRSMDHWVNGDPEAAAGVAVSASTPHLPKKSFSTMPTHFPNMTAPNRLRGLIAGVDDLPAFAANVRDEVWSGL
jgi:hypothetical protein